MQNAFIDVFLFFVLEDYIQRAFHREKLKIRKAS